MIPLPVNPSVVILLDPNDKLISVQGVASNISPELNVAIVHSPEEFAELAAGKPFVETGIQMESCCGACACGEHH